MSRQEPAADPVLVGVDGSGPARQAAAWAAREADLRGAALEIACVVDRVRPGQPPTADSVLGRCAAVARIAAPGLTPRTTAWFGRPAEILDGLAHHAQLVVVGHHGSGRVRPAPGSTAAALARRHPAALAVVRTAPGRPLPDLGRPLLVAVDGRPGSAALVDHAAGLAAQRGAQLHIAHVRTGHVGQVLARLGHRERTPYRQRAEQALAAAADSAVASHPGIVVRTSLERGHPGWTLVELTDDAQLVVLGTHRGRGAGSCVSTLLQGAACPVLIVDPR
ncbi:MAG: universal stress protein [Pseudonocardia sp.]|nr:universal stress protein [Pseudonocardia sp.]